MPDPLDRLTIAKQKIDERSCEISHRSAARRGWHADAESRIETPAAQGQVV
jgi:hypothetical protein